MNQYLSIQFYDGSRHFPEKENHGTSIGQRSRIVYWFTYIFSNKDMLYKVSSIFLWKTRRKAVLKIIEDFQKNIDGRVRF